MQLTCICCCPASGETTMVEVGEEGVNNSEPDPSVLGVAGFRASWGGACSLWPDDQGLDLSPPLTDRLTSAKIS